MLIIYRIAFFTGILYTITTLVLGQLFDSIDTEINIGILPIKPITVVSFITVFGGVGIMTLQKNMSIILSLVISVFSAYVVSFLLYKFIITPLYRAQNTSAHSQKDLVGTPAIVKASILENGFGQISYVVNGNTYDSPAKHKNGEYVKKGTNVLIVKIENNVYYVERRSTYFYDPQEDK